MSRGPSWVGFADHVRVTHERVTLAWGELCTDRDPTDCRPESHIFDGSRGQTLYPPPSVSPLSLSSGMYSLAVARRTALSNIASSLTRSSGVSSNGLQCRCQSRDQRPAAGGKRQELVIVLTSLQLLRSPSLLPQRAMAPQQSRKQSGLPAGTSKTPKQPLRGARVLQQNRTAN